jgi:hypothetical protein
MPLKTVTYDDAEWQLVSKEPTEKMLGRPAGDWWTEYWRLVYKAMLADAKFIQAGQVLPAEGMLRAALRALNSQAGYNSSNTITVAALQRETFVKLLAELVEAQQP